LQRSLALVGRHPTLLDAARQVAIDCRASAFGELVRHLTPDRVETRLHADLRDASAHRPEADDANPHTRDPTASMTAVARSNCSSESRMCEWRQRLCGKMPAASTGGASCRSWTTTRGRIGNVHAQRSRAGSF